MTDSGTEANANSANEDAVRSLPAGWGCVAIVGAIAHKPLTEPDSSLEGFGRSHPSPKMFFGELPVLM